MLIFLVFVFMGGVWTIDVSVSAMLVGNAVMTNGWFFRDPMQSYHVGLYMTIISAFAMSLILVTCSFATKVRKEKPNPTRQLRAEKFS